ncbi:MAG TPA: transposase [Gaiellales bacterium]|nr:transposase [Gaiellales bacterium]
MGRKPRIDHPGAIHHVTARGNAKADIFLGAADASVFLATLGTVVRDHGWSCFAYCLMPNHYHLLIETHAANLSVGMHSLNSAYARMFNAAHDRVGHVFQRRFHAEAVDTDEHMLEAMRYIALNPVRARLAATPAAWRWSSHGAMAGLCTPPRWLARDRAVRLFGPGGVDAYVRFVAEGATIERPRRETQAEMATRLGVSQATVSRMLRRE